MASDPVQERFAPDAPFRFIGGDASLDFVNTADWTPRGLERDRFTDYNRVVEWAESAGLLRAAESRRFAQAAAKHPRRATSALEAARDARVVLRDVFSATLAGRQGTSAFERFNTLLRDAASHVQVVRDGSDQLSLGWADLGESPESLLWPVVWSAATLLSSGDVDRLRMCAGQDCGWLYVDRSRNGLRRWCEMSVCGTAEKNRRRTMRY